MTKPKEKVKIKEDGPSIFDGLIIRKFAGMRADYDIAVRQNRMVISVKGQHALKAKPGDFIFVSKVRDLIYVAMKPKGVDVPGAFRLGKASKSGPVNISSKSFTDDMLGAYVIDSSVIEKKYDSSRNQVNIIWYKLKREES